MKAIVDCNNFYCSCERLFKPELKGKPLVVLSNNDGCIVSRSDEAKALGIAMAGPYFQAKPLIRQHNVTAFSSNYHLYGDLSWRVMETLRLLLPPGRVEVYSVDEAFLDLDHIPKDQIRETAIRIRTIVEQWTGIAVSIGVAPTKVLSKIANRLAKKHKDITDCVLVLDSPRTIQQALVKTDIEDIWGVGFRYAHKLRQQGINNAYELSIKDPSWGRKYMGGVTGTRLLKELRGESCIEMGEDRLVKKMIATTRMFGSPVHDVKDIKEAIATYTSRAAEKLRRQHGAAKVVSVFIVPKEQSHNTYFRHGPTISSHVTLPLATSLTQELIKPAVELAEQLYEEGRTYKKAGVMLSGIVPDESVQGNLFMPETLNNRRLLMSTMDNVNFAMRDDILKFASSGTARNWKMRQELRSPRYTTRWDELCEVS